MSLESTETSIDVPESYGGILDPRVRSDDSGNVTGLGTLDFLAESQPEDVATEAAIDPKWRRSEALHQLIALLPFVPDEMRSGDLASLLADADTIADWLEGK